jgi:hypothetical protein
MVLRASARVAKRFFIDFITRDITLEDSLLDLIDNSIDSLIRARHIDVTVNLLQPPRPKIDVSRLPTVDVDITPDQISVTDHSGGIPLKLAKEEVFNFGTQEPAQTGTLGVYGIGLKRAMFKLGEELEITSRTTRDGFSVHLDVPKWKADHDNWTIPMKRERRASSASKAGTIIEIRKLRPDIKMRIIDGTLASNLTDTIGTTYCLFLDRHIRLRLNGSHVSPRPIPLGGSAEVVASKDEFSEDSVHVTIYAGLAARLNGKWSIDRAGWYVLCNGRVVVSADKSELTGWAKPNAQFVSKYRGFVGIVFFFSDNPDTLPWTTTKRGMNVESLAYQIARRHMVEAAQPVISFLNRMYPGDEQENIFERGIANDVTAVDVRLLTSAPRSTFEANASPNRKAKTTVKVQYGAEVSELDRARRALRKPSWGASKIGRYALDYFLDREAPK